METNTLLVFPVQLSKLCLRSNVANAAKVSASPHMCGSDHRSNRAHLTLAAWTSAIWDSSMSASRRSLDGVPPIVQDTPPTRKRGKSLAGQQRRCNGHSLAWCKLCKHDRAAGLGGNRGDCRHRLMPRPNTGMQSETGIKDFLSLVR